MQNHVLLLLDIVLITLPSHAFEPISSYRRSYGNNIQLSPRGVASALKYSQNPFEDESSEQREQRMQLVREVQKTFYSDEVGVYPPQHGVYNNMPLYRGDWTELPGFQHDMNVTDPNYINMLMKVVSSSRPWYFGGAANVDNDNFRLEIGSDAPLVGTLMQVSDYSQLDDGRLYVVVQALGRFSVVDTVRRGSPYGIATVEMLPDGEMVGHFYEEAEDTAASFDFALNDDTRGAACAGAIAEAGEWHSYEFQAVEAENTLEAGGATLPPVASFDAEAAAATNGDAKNVVHTAIEEYLSQSPSNMHQGECSLADDFDMPSEEDALDMEHKLWIELDALAKILSELNPKANTEMPIPTQMLGLLPTDEGHRPWPKEFKLDRYTKKMSNVYSILGKANSRVQIDKGKQDQLKTAEGYPRLRRARRLSYIIWALLDTILGADYIKDRVTKQEILEMGSTTARLQAALIRIQEINATLRQVISENM